MCWVGCLLDAGVGGGGEKQGRTMRGEGCEEPASKTSEAGTLKRGFSMG